MRLQQRPASHAIEHVDPPSHPVIVAMDGSYAAGEALLWAARFSEASGRQLTAVRTWHRGLGNTGPSAAAATQRHLRHELSGWCQLGRAAEVAPRLVLSEGDAADAIATLAEREQADLTVVGTESFTGSRLDETSVPHRLAARTTRPLAIVPTGGAARVTHDVIVAVTGSVRSVAACRWVGANAIRCRWNVHVVTVFEPFLEWVPANDPRSIWRRLQREVAGPWTRALTEAGVPFSFQVIEGLDHVDALARLARDRHADAIVVGAEGHTTRRHRRQGHTGIHLVDHSHLPVIVVPVHLAHANPEVPPTDR